MLLIAIGAALIIIGVVLSTVRTLKRGRLSQGREAGTGEPRDTLEPKGRGDRLSFMSDLPGIVLFVFGAALIFLGAAL